MLRISLYFLASIFLFAQDGERHSYVSDGAGGSSGLQGRAAREIASEFVRNSAGISPADFPNVFLSKEYKTDHNGVSHFAYRQHFQGIEVSNAVWAVNVSSEGEVLSSGGVLYAAPAQIVSVPGTALQAVRAAVQAVNPKVAETYAPFELPAQQKSARVLDHVRYAGGDLGGEIDGRLVWFGLRGTLHLAWEFLLTDEDRVSSFSIAVEAETGAVLDKQPMSFFQSAPRALIFDQGSPQPSTPGVRSSVEPKIVDRVSVPLSGDLVASPSGWLSGTETSGNNVIAGANPLGQFPSAPITAKAKDGGFTFPLTLGPGAPSPVLYADAAAANLFFWVNRAHDLHYRYGFNEPAGNFQASNFGRGGLGGDALLAYTHFGSAGQVSPALRNAFFNSTSFEDGAPSYIALYVGYSNNAGFFTDAAYDADIIVHEYTHGVSWRLVNGGYQTFQGRSMGEAWSDFYSLEYLIPDGAPPDGIYGPGQYYFQSFGSGLRSRPFSTNLEVNPLTYANLGNVILAGPEVHADGEIWVEALWEARAKLIDQFGEIEGRRRIRQLVMDGMKLTTPFPSMVDARDGILLADRVGFKGESQGQLWAAFAKRGLGALAHSVDGTTLHVLPSFDLPSPTGRVKFYEESFVVGEPVRVILADSNYTQPNVRIQLTSTAGDLEDMVLERTGSIYFGTIPSSGNPANRQNGTINIGTFNSISAYYVDFNPAAGAANLVQATAATTQPYSITTAPQFLGFPNESRILTTFNPVQITLPFEFPFYSKKYRRVTVLPTGALEFEPSANTNLLSGAGCADVVEFGRMSGVAPYLHNLMFGTAQPLEGVYLSSPVPGLITFRWAAETRTPFTANNGDPVNFAVTLTQDGVIQFHYGPGNAATQPIQGPSGCRPGPVVGISSGHDVYTHTAILRSLTNAVTLRFEPPFDHSSDPVVRLERPVQGDTVGEVLTVTGVAYDARAAISRVEVFVDDILRAVTAPNVSRTDVCSREPVTGCPFIGYQTTVDLAAMRVSPGPHTVWVRATNSRGGFTSTADKITITTEAVGRTPKGAVESPLPDAQVNGFLSIRGYAYFDDLRVNRVDVLIDGVTYPLATYGLTRADICGRLQPVPPACPSIGFAVTIDTRTGIPPLPDGPHTLHVRVLDEAGRFTLLNPEGLKFTVKNPDTPAPEGALTAPRPGATLRGTVDISGYAYSARGRIVQVSVLLDGTAVATARYGTPATEVCQTLKATFCPNIGFTATLDTRGFVNGPHVLGVRITDELGVSSVVPTLNRSGMNVSFDNPR